MSTNVNCPRCGKTFEVPDEAGKSWSSCPHCHAANPQAGTVLDVSEPVEAPPPAVAVTANPPREPLPGLHTTTVTCPRCRKPFAVPAHEGRTWLSCPHCHEVNTEALFRSEPKSFASGCAATLLLVLGILGLVGGTLLSCLGMGLSNRAGSEVVVVPTIWAIGSLAITATGWWLLRPAKSVQLYKTIWGPSSVFVALLLLGFCCWIFAFVACTGVMR